MAANLPLTNLQKLVPFVQAVHSGSFVAAASELRVTPPAISKSIASLEEELGVRLFNRTTRRLALTAEGRAFHARVAELLGGLGDAVSSLRDATEMARGRLKVSVTPTFGRYALLPKIAQFTQRYPEVELELGFDEVPPGMVEANLDVRIQHGRGDETTLVSRLLCDYPLVLVAHPDYLARRGVPRTPADLASHDIITIHQHEVPRWELLRLNGEPGRFVFKPKGQLVMRGQFDTTVLAALYGAGITATAELVAADYVAAGRLAVVLPEYRLRGRKATQDVSQIYVQVQNRRHMAAKVRVFLDFLYECFSHSPRSAAKGLRRPGGG